MGTTFRDKSDEEVWKCAEEYGNTGSPLANAAQSELIRRATQRMANTTEELSGHVQTLNALIERFDRSSTRLARGMLWLTAFIFLLTLVTAWPVLQSFTRHTPPPRNLTERTAATRQSDTKKHHVDAQPSLGGQGRRKSPGSGDSPNKGSGSVDRTAPRQRQEGHK